MIISPDQLRADFIERAKTRTAKAAGAEGSDATKGPDDFGQMLAGLVKDAAGALKTGEATAISGLQGQASVQQVVESVMRAEQQFQVALAVRDKVVAAYLELNRMPI